MGNQTTYRIRTRLGETEPINIPVSLMQEYDSFEILSLKVNTDGTYRSYTSGEGIVIGRVSTQNNGLGIPNVRVSVFVPKGEYSQSDEEKVLYPFSSPMDSDGDRIRYNLLPGETDVDCYQVIGTLPSKRRILDNETVCDVFDKYYKYTTVTNEAGDFMLVNIPVGQHRIHIDADLSDIGPFLSQKPYDMIENLGFDKNRFESTRRFKTSSDLDSLAQVISQNKSVYVYPYWGDSTENGSELKITRTDLSLNYEFKTSAVFMGSVITDKQSNSIRQNCTATENAGKMSDMVTGPGRIEMIRKTVDNKVEQYRVKGDMLINDNGVWCYSVPMNLDYVRTDEFGKIVPTDDPDKGIPTRARVRFRVTLNEMESDDDAHKRCSYLVPNNPKRDDGKFIRENGADYSFGSETWDESFVDLLWNKVYTVKNYVPQIQKTTRPTNRKHTGIKMTNHFGDNNPFPYNSMSIKLSFQYRLICVIVHAFIEVIAVINEIISILGALPCWLANLKILGVRPFKGIMKFVPKCIEISSEFCDDGVNKVVTYPGCSGCVWDERTKPSCENSQGKVAESGGEPASCISYKSMLFNCVENQLAQSNEATSFNFGNDWINGCLYMPLWYRHIKPKKRYFFGLFKRSAKDQWCSGENGSGGRSLKMATFCTHKHRGSVESLDYKGNDVNFHKAEYRDNCGNDCHERVNWVELTNGLIINRETLTGQKAWYYKAVECANPVYGNLDAEYVDYRNKAMVSKTLYATDIVLLGSLNDCDENGIPKFFNYLKGSTYNMPSDVLFTDTEHVYNINADGEYVEQEGKDVSVSSGCDWGNTNEYNYSDGGLFYSIGCSDIEVNDKSCYNLKRICEIGVGLDEMKYVENIKDANVSSESDTLDYNNLDYFLRPDGFISYDDIIDFDYRSMFATMNGNRLRTKLSKETGLREYDFRYLYVDNFDGSLYEFMKDSHADKDRANYRFNYKLEQPSVDYLTFRMGDVPYYYDGKGFVDYEKSGWEGPGDYKLPKYMNSFYFYFGLKDGKTAIDEFNEKYNGPCGTNTEIVENIPYEKKVNSWCCKDDADGYSHSGYDGYLRVGFENIPLPCTAMFNSKDNDGVSYTVTKEDGDVNISDEFICFYGSDDSEATKDGYVRYFLKYEDGNGVKNEKCQMLNNDGYVLSVTDGEGHIHSFEVSLNGEYLVYDNSVRAFGKSNGELISLFGDYDTVARTGKVYCESDESGLPVVRRVYEPDGGDSKKINGTICLYNIMQENSIMGDFRIDVEPYDKETVAEGDETYEIYSDKDFWLPDGDGRNTWYKKTALVAGGHIQDTGNDYFSEIVMRVSDTNEVACYVIKCPKGDVNYRVRITQVCKNGEEQYDDTKNYVETKVFVGQPTPYKLLINGIDYDIIKNFKTGWTLSESARVQFDDSKMRGRQKYGPFNNDVGNIADIEGWLNMGDVNNIYDWDADPEKYGGTDERFEKCNTTEDEEKYGSEYVSYGEYKMIAALDVKKKWEPKEPQHHEGERWEDYEKAYELWQSKHDEWENGRIDSEGKRMEGYDDWTTIGVKSPYGGVCGYVYAEQAAKHLLNRLEFVKKMKVAFYMTDESGDKTISINVMTDDTPYHVWMVYNPEFVSTVDEDYNETDSEYVKNKRHYWNCIGESVSSITNIKVPNLTANKSDDFGINGDRIRLDGYNTTHDDKKCFAQDNIAGDSTEGSISIKPPYIVACVNNEGITKPYGLTKNDFFAQDSENKYGIKPYRFGDITGNRGYLSNGGKEFFQFYIIDKKFTADIAMWPYVPGIPYYVPWFDYNAENSKIGQRVSVHGIMSGLILNGITDSKGVITDFEECTAFDKEFTLKTLGTSISEPYVPMSEDDIPTERCILFNGDETNDVYLNYRHTEYIEESNQCMLVPRREGELTVTDSSGNGRIARTLSGNMRISLKSGDGWVGKYDEDGKLSKWHKCIRVKCSGIDSDTNIMYYRFKASKEEVVTEFKDDNTWYPLNSYERTVKGGDETTETFKMDFNGEAKPWDATTGNACHMFSRVTDKNTLRKFVNVSYAIDFEKGVSIDVGGVRSDGEFGVDYEKVTDTVPYYIVAVADNGCRAISPVYDMTDIYYVIGFVKKGDKRYLRTALSYVLKAKGASGDNIPGDWGGSSTESPYGKKPRNYYLTQFDFSIDYEITDGNDTFSCQYDVPKDGNYGSTPHFMNYHDEECNFEFEEGVLKDDKKTVFCVTDVTGMRHKCKCFKFISYNSNEWDDKVSKVPS